MKTIILFFGIGLLLLSFRTPAQPKNPAYQAVAAVLDSLNVRAARADFQAYFELYAEDAIFMGTDATERWTKSAFAKWSKKFFDRGKAWSFKALQRHIYFSQDGKMAWFDELLDTQMKVCRGSGVLRKEGKQWRIVQYTLSTTVPNTIVDQVTELKRHEEDSLIQVLRKKQD